MVRYSRQEDEIIVSTVRKYSRIGAPLNIQAALDEAGDIIFEKFKINRTIPALLYRYYNVLRKKYQIFGYANTKNTWHTKGVKVSPRLVQVGKKTYQLTLNLTPAVSKKLQHS